MSGVLIVTGASRGIGAACARRAAQAGWKVAVNYAHSRDGALAVVADIERAGGTAVAIGADVAQRDQVERLFVDTERLLGPVTGLVNNAGVGGAVTPIGEQTEAMLAPMFATNVYGYIYCAGAAIARMSTRRGGNGGVIVNISSMAARLGGLPNMVAYAASKGATDTLTIGIAKEVAKEGIRVNAVRPGVIDTDILNGVGRDKILAAVAPMVPMGRTGESHEIAEAVIWLLSPAASYVHGSILDVSGGR